MCWWEFLTESSRPVNQRASILYKKLHFASAVLFWVCLWHFPWSRKGHRTSGGSSSTATCLETLLQTGFTNPNITAQWMPWQPQRYKLKELSTFKTWLCCPAQIGASFFLGIGPKFKTAHCCHQFRGHERHPNINITPPPALLGI